jgi:hypothetical protein
VGPSGNVVVVVVVGTIAGDVAVDPVAGAPVVTGAGSAVVAGAAVVSGIGTVVDATVALEVEFGVRFVCCSEDSELDSELCSSEDLESHFRCLFRCRQGHLPVTSTTNKQQRSKRTVNLYPYIFSISQLNRLCQI